MFDGDGLRQKYDGLELICGSVESVHLSTKNQVKAIETT